MVRLFTFLLAFLLPRAYLCTQSSQDETGAASLATINEHGSVVSRTALMRRDKPTGCGDVKGALGGGVSWQDPIIVKPNLKIGQGNEQRDRDHTLVNLPSYFIGGLYVRSSGRLPKGDDWTWEIKITAPAKVYVFVTAGWRQGDKNAGLDASVKADGWTEEKAPGFHRSDKTSHTFKVWSKVFSAGVTSAKIKHLKGELLAGAVSSACGGITSCSGGGVEWNHPVVLEDMQQVSPGSNEFKLVNVPASLIGGRYIGSKTAPKGKGWSWTLKYKPPVKLNIWVWADVSTRPHDPKTSNLLKYNAGLNMNVRAAGWKSEPAAPFHRSDNPSYRLEVWSKVFTDGSETVIQPLDGELVAGVVSTAA